MADRQIVRTKNTGEGKKPWDLRLSASSKALSISSGLSGSERLAKPNLPGQWSHGPRFHCLTSPLAAATSCWNGRPLFFSSTPPPQSVAEVLETCRLPNNFFRSFFGLVPSDQLKGQGTLHRALLCAGVLCLPGLHSHQGGPKPWSGVTLPPHGRPRRWGARPTLPLLCPGWSVQPRAAFVGVSRRADLGWAPLNCRYSCVLLRGTARRQHHISGVLHCPCWVSLVLGLTDNDMKEVNRQGRVMVPRLPGGLPSYLRTCPLACLTTPQKL